MTQWYWTADDYSVDDVPSDAWAMSGAGTSFSIVNYSGFNAMQLQGLNASGSFWRFTPVPEIGDVEVYFTAELLGSHNAGAMLQWNGDPVSWSLYKAMLRDDSVHGGISENGSSLDAQFFGEYLGSGLISVRARRAGTSFLVRGWHQGDPEPGTWMDYSPQAALSSGYVGYYRFWQGSHILEFGVGTDGDPAPSVPVSARRRSPLLLLPY